MLNSFCDDLKVRFTFFVHEEYIFLIEIYCSSLLCNHNLLKLGRVNPSMHNLDVIIINVGVEQQPTTKSKITLLEPSKHYFHRIAM